MAEGDRPNRYDALIGQRQRETDQAARQLALRERELVKVRTQRGHYAEALNAVSHDSRVGQELDMNHAALEYGRGAVLRQALARSDMRIDQLQRDADARRAELVEARKRLRAAEVLRERLHERIATERARKERVEMDDIAVLRHEGEPPA